MKVLLMIAAIAALLLGPVVGLFVSVVCHDLLEWRGILGAIVSIVASMVVPMGVVVSSVQKKNVPAVVVSCIAVLVAVGVTAGASLWNGIVFF